MAVKKRIFYYDLLRAIAIIAIILCHVRSVVPELPTVSSQLINAFSGCIGYLGVPIFFTLSGALLLNRTQNLRDFFKKRFTRIIYPFLFWMILIIPIGYFYFKWDFEHAFNFFFGMGSLMWYVWTILGLYLFIPFFDAYFKEYGFKGFEFYLVIWLISAFLYSLGHAYFELVYFNNFIGFFILGYYLDNKQFRLSDRSMCILGVIIFLVSTFLYTYIVMDFGFLDLFTKYKFILIIMGCAGLFVFIKYLDKLSVNNIYSRIRENLIGKAIISLSVCSYGMYFAHALMIRYLKLFKFHNDIWLLILLVVVVFMAWLVTYIFSKIPYIKKVCGV